MFWKTRIRIWSDYFFHRQPDGKTAASELLEGKDEPWPLEKTISLVKELKPRFNPGKKGKAAYSDTNYQLLGKIIENITGKSINETLDEFIFSPLSLQNTYVYSDVNDTSSVPFYYKSKKLWLPEYMVSISPEGGIVSTAAETMIFLKAFFGGRFFPEQYIDDLKKWNFIFIPGMFYYGIGLEKLFMPRILYEPGLKLDPGTYDIAGKGLANLIEREMKMASYEINEYGVQAHYVFHDLHNREVLIRIKEGNPRERKPFGLLAPMGDAAKNPSAMPLILLHDFYFVRKKHSEIDIVIAGRPYQIDNLPMRMDGTRMTFIRYSSKPLIITLNPAFKGEIACLTLKAGTERIISENYEYLLGWEDELPYLKSIIFNNDIHPLELRFKDRFPDIISLADKTSLKGRFEIEGHHSTGRISGHYTIEKDNDRVTIKMVPSGGWKPRPDKFSLRFLYTVARVFKKWPATYEWTAEIVEKNGVLTMKSVWNRIRKND